MDRNQGTSSQQAEPSLESRNRKSATEDDFQINAPSLTLPKGGGAIRGIGEKFAANPVTGTASMTIPIAASTGRAGFGPQLSLSYDSGSGNGPFGLGWSLSLSSIARKTDKGLPTYRDGKEADVFVLSGSEDLVPCLKEIAPGEWQAEEIPPRRVGGQTYTIHRYRPRIEGLFARIERWTNQADPSDISWRSISKNNVTAWYGKTPESRIADSEDPRKIFRWLVCETYDDKGNAMVYRYIAEDSAQVDVSLAHERNRTAAGRSVNRYLKRVQYGNKTSRLIQPDPAQMDWSFELVFDYGSGHYRELDLDPQVPSAQQHRKVEAALEAGDQDWPVRPDPFSDYRAGFEIRTYRRCQRVLMFHRFEELGTEPVLVRSTEFQYNDLDTTNQHTVAETLQYPGSTRFASHLQAVTQSGMVHQTHQPITPTDVENKNGARYVTYIKKSMSPLQFEYSKAAIQQKVQSVDTDDLENLPQGLDAGRYQWIDLDGEGTGGILTRQGGAWFYKRNLSPLNAENKSGSTAARFAPVERVNSLPSLAPFAGGQQPFLDLAGDGRIDWVNFDRTAPGFFERNTESGWQMFRPFESWPNIDWNDSNLQFVDLTGDGHADILITRDDVLVWYPSLAEQGFTASEKIQQALDEEQGPKLMLADGTQSIYLADLSGDGLTDLVRIRNGEVCYWPNLGYGRFGTKVTMDNSPVFDQPDQFDQRRIRLADIDGSGVTDILYIREGMVCLYFNEAGNRWTDAEVLKNFPQIDNLSSVVAVDLLGNGTACLVWSSPTPSATGHPLLYVDLMGGQKPHLLVKTVNNLGAETRIHYAPSTRFYLQDKQEGNPWITRLNFPVHVVERVETYDHISRNRFVTRYSYHHGYFDGTEREFRGFGRVDQIDTEEFAALNTDSSFPEDGNIDAASHVPPVRVRRWFHTGSYQRMGHISKQFKEEYYREPGSTDAEFEAGLLPDTVFPPGLSAEEQRQAARALKGTLLRQEIYALDGTEKEIHPYAVTEQDFSIRTLQPQGGNQHAVFLTHPREATKFQYERNPEDPRVEQALTLQVDDFGNVMKSANVVYGRSQPSNDPQLGPKDHLKQTRTHIIYSEVDFTNAVDAENDYRAPIPWQKRDYELTGYPLYGNQDRYKSGDFVSNGVSPSLLYDSEIPYENSTGSGPQRRLVEQSRTRFRSNSLSQVLPDGVIETLAVPAESYRLAFTPGLVSQNYGQTGLLANPVTVMSGNGGDQGGYVDLDNDGHWWVRSGKSFFDRLADHSNPSQTAAQELATARQHFFLPQKFVDPFNAVTTVEYDFYQLAVIRTENFLGNETRAEIDYRVLQTWAITDMNGNRSEMAFDALGLVSASAILGTNQESGDSLQNLVIDLTEKEVQNFLQDPLALAASLLGKATVRLVYDVDRYFNQGKAAVSAALMRERHVNSPKAGPSPVEVTFNYSDGMGRNIQSKIQAEPGPVEPDSPVANPRWIGSGWTIFNNKGQPVRQYEPFFTIEHDFEFAHMAGVSPIVFYDPLSRPVATLHPNHSWEKNLFDPWRHEFWDVNDTVLLDPLADPHVGPHFARLPEDEVTPTWYQQRSAGALGPAQQEAANKTAIHAATPTVIHLDSLGRTFLTLAHNRFERQGNLIEEFHRTGLELDIEGNQRKVIDALGRQVMVYDYNLLGEIVHQIGMDAGERWLLQDSAGNPIRAWDSRGHSFRNEYDSLRRPLNFLVSGTGNQSDPDVSGQDILYQKYEYGEGQIDAQQRNLRGRVLQSHDGAGVMTHLEFDFKGNLLQSTRQLVVDYKSAVDWSAVVALEPEVYLQQARYDALNRVVESTSPDQSVLIPRYNEANLLDGVALRIHGGNAVTDFVNNIDYDVKGQRQRIEYGNGVTTAYEYDPLTFRLTRLLTLRNNQALQDLNYTHDPAGNITRLEDDAQQTVYFDNIQTDPHNDYIYDAVYRLIQAQGREHRGQQSAPQTSWTDSPRINPASPRDGQAMGTYTEDYWYDAAGNIQKLVHQGNSAFGNWTRDYAYNDASPININETGNRLSSSIVGNNSETYSHDSHGNILNLPHLNAMRWNFRDHLQEVDLGGGGTAYYVYDADGQRVRKVIDRQNGSRRNQRVYLADLEIYREYAGDGNNVTLERETLHVMDDNNRIALIETRTQGDDGSAQMLIRYQMNNHLGSSALELDRNGAVASYEEFYPYGSTAYQAVRNQTEVPSKRYRFSGRERDDETGLNYHGARYYASWLARWVSADPEGLVDGVNLYAYVRGSPVMFHDPAGTQSVDPNSLTDIGVSPEEWKKLVSQRNLWERELNQWEKRASEINNTHKRGSAEWNEKMAYVQPRIAESRKKLKAVKKRIQTIDEARRVRQFTRQFIAKGGFLQTPKSDSASGKVGESAEGTVNAAPDYEPGSDLSDPRLGLSWGGKIHNPQVRDEAWVRALLAQYRSDLDGAIAPDLTLFFRHNALSTYDFHFHPEFWDDTFHVPGVGPMKSDEFGNFIAGYGAGATDSPWGNLLGVRLAGGFFGAIAEIDEPNGAEWRFLGDNANSVKRITQGFMAAQNDRADMGPVVLEQKAGEYTVYIHQSRPPTLFDRFALWMLE